MTALDLDLDYDTIDLGTSENDGTGTSLRAGGGFINANVAKTIANMRAIMTCVNTLSNSQNAGSLTMSLTTALDIELGQVVAIGNDGTAVLASNTLDLLPIGIATAAATSGMVNVLFQGAFTTSNLTTGSVYYLGESGNISTTAGDENVMIVGVATSETSLIFSPKILLIRNSVGVDDTLEHENGNVNIRELTNKEKLDRYTSTMASYPYNGSIDAAGNWVISSAAGSTLNNPVIMYANMAGNPTYTTLADAFTDRIGLNYMDLADLDL